jgi:hypothetical protein
VIAASLALGGLLALAPSETHSGACTTAEPEGVTVVIDYGGLGGGVQATCALGLTKSSTGRAALTAIGASISGTAHDGDGFVCRLNGRPSASETLDLPSGSYQEQCVQTPPLDAYWSYWSADDGGSWSYATSGVGQHRVKLGGFEGWSFNLGGSRASPPAFTPAKAPAPAQPTPATPPPNSGGGGAADSGSGTTDSVSAGDANTPGAAGSATPADPAAAGGPASGPTATDPGADSPGPDDRAGGDDSAGPDSGRPTTTSAPSGTAGTTRPPASGAAGGRTGRPQTIALTGVLGGSAIIAAATIYLRRRWSNP